MMQRQALMRVLLARGDGRTGESRGESGFLFDPFEDWWLDAVQAFKTVNGCRFPTATDYLWIAVKLGGFDHLDMTIEALLKRAMKYKDK